MTHPSRSARTDADRYAPIRWSSDSDTVDAVYRYCQNQYYATPATQYGEARRAILDRILSNLRNPIHRAYNGQKQYGEINFGLVARELTKFFDDTPADTAQKDGYLHALASEWDTLSGFFQKQYIKPDPD